MKHFIYISLFIVISNTCFSQEKRPNIVIILADDLGYGDVQCYGAKDIKTPNIDRLAKEGVRFTQFYANGPECTPTRTALMTGRYQQRVGGLECAIGSGNFGRYEEAMKLSDQGKLGLPTQFSVLPRILNEVGYNTAVIGKWHLGYEEIFRPSAHGFDYSIGPLGGGVDYFHHTEPEGLYLGKKMEGSYDMYRNDEIHYREGYYMTHLITDESVEWLNIQDGDTPFFLYVPFTAPHNPLQGPDDYQQENLDSESWGRGDRKDYISLVEELDKGIGEILDKIDSKGFSDNTLVIFFSDNGPTGKGSAGIFSGNKGQVFEGGIRVPCLIRWPGNLIPGITSEQMAISMDLTASISEIVEKPPLRGFDGIDIIGHVVNENEDYPRTLFWRKKRGDQVLRAVRDDNLKYIKEVRGTEVNEYLFDLKSDVRELNDLKDSRPGEFMRLKNIVMNWEMEVKPERFDIGR